jgi:hypothetical protein
MTPELEWKSWGAMRRDVLEHWLPVLSKRMGYDERDALPLLVLLDNIAPDDTLEISFRRGTQHEDYDGPGYDGDTWDAKVTFGSMAYVDAEPGSVVGGSGECLSAALEGMAQKSPRLFRVVDE